MSGRTQRLAETGRPPVCFTLDGKASTALLGDTVLTAVLSCGGRLRTAEFGPEGRAGFCLMGVCQDCWIWQEAGPRLRACTTPMTDGMRLLTGPPENWP